MSEFSYYNENDPWAVARLTELVKAGLIAPGDVDERSIEDVLPADLIGYRQCHFFAGIGVWSYALRQSGWPDNGPPVWTGSCPCQPFSAAGKGKGFADERHLWPAWQWLISQCRPDVIFGEQVASKDGRAWFDLVSTDLEFEGYTCGSSATVACGFGAPHKRQRLYWVADSEAAERRRVLDAEEFSPHAQVGGSGISGGMADAEHDDGRSDIEGRRPEGRTADGGSGATGSVADAGSQRQYGQQIFLQSGQSREERTQACGGCGSSRVADAERNGETSRPGPTNGFWRDVDWLGCRDGKWRPVEPGTFPLVDGATGRVGRLRGYGNAIVAQQAQAFIEAYMEVKL